MEGALPRSRRARGFPNLPRLRLVQTSAYAPPFPLRFAALQGWGYPSPLPFATPAFARRRSACTCRVSTRTDNSNSQSEGATIMSYTATYSPEDNKLRLYSSSRLPKDLYDCVKAAGFKWAPKQELFV